MWTPSRPLCYLPQQSGYNRRLRAAAGLVTAVIRALAADTTLWTMTCGWSTPPRWSAAAPGRRPNVQIWLGGPSTAAVPRTPATSGACACTWSPPLGGLPVGFAITGAKGDERQTLLSIFHADPSLVADRPGQTIIADKNHYGANFEHTLANAGIDLLRPARKGEVERDGARLFKPLRQTIESINQTFKGHLDLERHGGRTPAGVTVRILQRILALTAAIWHNDKTGQPIMRSLTACDH